MGWLIAVVLIIAVVYFLSRGAGSAQQPPQPAPQRQPSRQHAGAKRPPASTRQRPVAPTTPERWNSEGREIPFAEAGLKGPLFHYGGMSIPGAVEHRGPYAVIDFETTGLSPRRDRIVEVAVARVDASGRVEDEFATLINPDGRDVGPTFIHGIANSQVKDAPTFAEVAPELLARMNGAVVVAHNATFEEAFLAAELKRAGIDVPSMPALCTLWLGRQTFDTPNYKLGTLARAGGIALVDKHAALGDVRAVSSLLPLMTSRVRSPLVYTTPPLAWSAQHTTGSLPLVTRAVALRKGTDGWMHSLMARLPGSGLAPDNAAAEVYFDALAEVLADGRLTKEEAQLLAHLAGSAGMGGAQVLALNQRFLDGLKTAALHDDLLTPTELRQLRAAAKALSLPEYYGALQSTPPPQPLPLTVEPVGADNSNNSMEARGERGNQALAMQRAGSSRAEIAATLGVGLETVKALLRDSKFYENPESDPSRFALAREARQARETGLTCERFRRDQCLSNGKSADAWRDAAMLAKQV